MLKRFVTIAAFALALALLAPSVAATWRAYGSLEPDTALDATSGFMFQGPPTSTNQIYFNAMNAIAFGPAPNSATLGGRVAPPTASGFTAVLGVWRDCNHDGYIGLADGALREYRVEVSQAAGFPVDTNLCPSLNDAPANAGKIFNGNGWVTEMEVIGYSRDFNGNPTTIQTDYRTISDTAARVWADADVPTAPAPAVNTNPCTQLGATLSVPSLAANRGETQHTVTWLAYFDCQGYGPQALRDRVVAADTTGTLGVLPNPSSFYPNVGTFGTDQACKGGEPQPCTSGSNSIVSGEQDCSKSPTVVTSNRPNQHAGQSGIRTPGSLKVNPSGTVPATLNETVEESAVDDCDGTNDDGRDFYGHIENAGNGQVVGAKHRATNLAFRPWNTRQGASINGCGTAATGKVCGQPQDLGVPEVYNEAGSGYNMWTGGGATLARGQAKVDPSRSNIVAPDFIPALVWSFYAHVTSTDGATPHSGDGTYGQTQCSSGIGSGAPSANGWACDPTLWNQDGGTYDDTRQFEVAVGDSYQLLDVDCWDDTLVSGSSGHSPTSSDVGLRGVPVITDPNHRCP